VELFSPDTAWNTLLRARVEERHFGCRKLERTWFNGDLLASCVADRPEIDGVSRLVHDDRIANSIGGCREGKKGGESCAHVGCV
jgi:hypothetical protein